ncbi:HPr kinase/phosphorylase [Paraburkholderia aspalathi]|nr:HPr kinase/phosphorylase [Paraburkholderia aspalathi]
MMEDQLKGGMHSTTLQLDGRGILILGPSGSGKTEVALTLIERAQTQGRSAMFVADDRTILQEVDGKLIASVPPALAGGVEIRGAGLFSIPFCERTLLNLVVQLVPYELAERYPMGHVWTFSGVTLPCLMLPSRPFGADANFVARAIEATLFYSPWP